MIMLEKLKAAFEKARDKAEHAAAAAMPKDLIVPEHVSAERFATCLACEHLYKLTHSCKKCGCFMKVKTTLSKAACPINKWTTYTYSEENNNSQ